MVVSNTLAAPAPKESAELHIPPLENGAHLSALEFLRRFEAMPEVKKAELIDGIVYMASPVRLDQHGEPDSLMATWLGTYAISTPGVKHAINSTTRLGPDDVPQPDGLLRILPECGGQSRLGPKGYLHGAPEMVVEIAASSVSIDLREKRDSYRRAGVREYMVWRTQESEIDWWVLEDDEYRPLAPDADGIVRSRTFPGLWTKPGDLIAGLGSQVLAVLQAGLASPEHETFAASLKLRASSPAATP